MSTTKECKTDSYFISSISIGKSLGTLLLFLSFPWKSLSNIFITDNASYELTYMFFSLLLRKIFRNIGKYFQEINQDRAFTSARRPHMNIGHTHSDLFIVFEKLSIVAIVNRTHTNIQAIAISIFLPSNLQYHTNTSIHDWSVISRYVYWYSLEFACTSVGQPFFVRLHFKSSQWSRLISS